MSSVLRRIPIRESEIKITNIKASGPGGQNVNKVASAAQLRFNVRKSSLRDEIKMRLLHLSGKQAVGHDEIIIEARRYRTQVKNREDAYRRLVKLIERALVEPQKRRTTKPTASSIEKRLKTKKTRGLVKRSRQVQDSD